MDLLCSSRGGRAGSYGSCVFSLCGSLDRDVFAARVQLILGSLSFEVLDVDKEARAARVGSYGSCGDLGLEELKMCCSVGAAGGGIGCRSHKFLEVSIKPKNRLTWVRGFHSVGAQ